MRGTRFGSACAAIVVVCVLVTPAAPALAAATPLPQDAVLAVPGHGWGHGRGLGQWGARGLAEQGKTYAQILATYYSGTTLGTRSASEDIRVLVERSSDVLVTSTAPFTAVMGGRTVATSTSSQPFLRARWDGSQYVLERGASRTGSWSRVTASTAYPVFAPGSAMLRLVFASGSARVYRGQIHGRYSSEDGMRSINVLPIQSYLYGVVPSEMPSSWPAHALRAQAVAARTYAIYKKLVARARGTTFDICATTQCQVYSGYGSASTPTGAVTSSEKAATNDAIDATAGKVVLYDGAPILAEFSSSTGGYTAPGSVPYQRAVPDPGDAISPHHDWRAQITVREVETRWPQIGRLTDIAITERDGYGEWGGRVQRMRLDGTQGSLEISGGAWRTAFAWPGRSNGVRGTFFTVVLYAGTLVSAPSQIVIPLGTSRTYPVRIRNTGTGSWPVGGSIRLGTDDDSALATGAWISPTRAASVARNVTDPSRSTVAPGQIAEFDIPLTGSRVGIVTETFRQYADEISPMTPAFTTQVQTVSPWLDEAPNLLSSPSFDDGVAPWTFSGTDRGDGAVSQMPRHGARSLRLLGGGVQRVTQTVALAGGAGRTFTFGGWNRTEGTSGAGGAIDLIATARYTDGTSSSLSLPFAKVPHAWVYDERTFTTHATKTLASVALIARTVNQTGATYFDGLRIHEGPVMNASFEDGLTDWVRDGFVSGDGVTAGASRDGGRALVLTGATGTKRVTQSLQLRARRTERFALSFWHRAQGAIAGGTAALRLTLRTGAGDEYPTTIDVPRDDHDWTFVETVVRAPADISGADIAVEYGEQQGKITVDAIRLTRTFTADPSVESGLAAWTAYGVADPVVEAVGRAREGARGIQFTGTSGRQGVVQQVAVASGPGVTFRLQGWSRSSALAARGGFAGYVVVFRNTDGTSTGVGIPIAAGTQPWTFTEKAVRSVKRFSRVDVYAQLNQRSGTVWFDALRLVRA